MVTCLRRDRVSLFAVGLILLFMIGLVRPVSAGDDEVVTLTANPSSVTVTAGGSASTTMTLTDLPGGGPITNLVIDCVGLPSGASCFTTPNPLSFPLLFSDNDHFILTVSVPSSTAPGTYLVKVQLTSYETPSIVQPGFFAVSPVRSGSSGGIGPTSINIQQTPPAVTISVIVSPPIGTATTMTTVPHIPAPVGGVMLRRVGFTVLLPWVVLLSLLGAVSVEAFIYRRRAKRC